MAGTILRMAHDLAAAYELALEAVATVHDLTLDVPDGRSPHVDRLRRSSLAVGCHLADSANALSPDESATARIRAHRAVTRSAIFLEICASLRLLEGDVE